MARGRRERRRTDAGLAARAIPGRAGLARWPSPTALATTHGRPAAGPLAVAPGAATRPAAGGPTARPDRTSTPSARARSHGPSAGDRGRRSQPTRPGTGGDLAAGGEYLLADSVHGDAGPERRRRAVRRRHVRPGRQRRRGPAR